MTDAAVDMVNQPPHYNNGKVECIEAIEASMSDEEFIGYLKGNALKYLWRYRYKQNAVADLEKSNWYLTRLTDFYRAQFNDDVKTTIS